MLHFKSVFIWSLTMSLSLCLCPMTTATTGATTTSNWWVVGVKRNFGRFYTLFVMNFRENDFWSQPSKNRCIDVTRVAYTSSVLAGASIVSVGRP